MKRKLLAIIIAISTSGAFAQNVELKNGSFEEWKSGSAMPTHWGAYYNDIEAGIYSQSKDTYNGTCALRIDFEPKKENDNRRFFSFPTKLESGKYSLTLHMKGKGDIRFISFTKKDENAGKRTNNVNVASISEIKTIDSPKWETHTLDFDIKETDSYQLFICFNAADKLLIDHIALSKE